MDDSLQEKFRLFFGREETQDPPPRPNPLAEAEKQRLRMRYVRFYSIRVFLEESGCICRGPDQSAASQALYDRYCSWCIGQSVLPECYRSFCLYLKENAPDLNIRPSNKIRTSDGTFCRGYRGIGLLGDT